MLHLATDTKPLGFPDTPEETEYLQDRIRTGWDLVTILPLGLAYRYYWQKSDNRTNPSPIREAVTQAIGQWLPKDKGGM